MTDLLSLVQKRRSVRRFREDEAVGADELRALVNLARLGSSAVNRQPLRYILSATPEQNARIFANLIWGARLSDWAGPEAGERPAAYIVVLAERGCEITAPYDAGIAVGTMMLGAVDRGLGGCIHGGFDRDGLRDALNVPEEFNLMLVLALGKPAEAVVLDDVGADGDTAYWRDGDGTHHVPKRTLDDVIVDFD